MQELRFQFTDAFMSIGFFEVSIDPGFVRFQHGHKSFKKMGKLLLQAIINRKQNQLKPLSEKLYQLDFFLEMMKTECDHLRQNVDESTGEDRKTWIRLYVREKRYLNLYCKAMETQFGSDCSQFKEETDGHIVTNTPSHRTPPQSTGSKRTAVQAELATQSWPPQEQSSGPFSIINCRTDVGLHPNKRVKVAPDSTDSTRKIHNGKKNS